MFYRRDQFGHDVPTPLTMAIAAAAAFGVAYALVGWVA